MSQTEKSFTAAIANDPRRRRLRTVPGLCTSSQTLDVIQGYVSVLTSGLLVIIALTGTVLLLPSIAYTYLSNKDNYFNSSRGIDNISTSLSTGSITAIKALSARAQMFRQRSGGPDDISSLFMDRLSLLGDGVPDQLAYLMPNFMFGEAAFLQARTCWFDDCVEEFVRHNPKSNVVILGAGYDSRGYRLNLRERGIRVFEVDAPGTQMVKRRIIEECDLDTAECVTYVPCDFGKQDWLECLKEYDFDQKLPTLFVWEGVTYYLSRETIIDTLKKVLLCAKGSCIGFDYVYSSWALSPQMMKITARGGEPWLFGLSDADEADRFVVSNGLCVMDHINSHQMRERYLAKHFDGRSIGYLDEFGGFILVGNL